MDPSETTYTVSGLNPATAYRFRLRAVNDLGPSPWSKESNVTKTLPASPSKKVSDVRVTPITRTNVRVEWTPLLEVDFNGDSSSRAAGYRVEYRSLGSSDSESHVTDIEAMAARVDLAGVDKDRVVLEDLSIGQNYEITVSDHDRVDNAK